MHLLFKSNLQSRINIEESLLQFELERGAELFFDWKFNKSNGDAMQAVFEKVVKISLHRKFD